MRTLARCYAIPGRITQNYSTIQLLGAVLLPSYVLIPVAGDSFGTLYILGGACMIVCGLISMLFLPKNKEVSKQRLF